MSSEQTLKTLRRKRGNLKTKLTSLQSFIDKFNQENLENVSHVRIIELEKRLARSENILDEFESIQNEIESLAEIESESETHASFEDMYFATLANAQEAIRIANSSMNASAEVSETSQGAANLAQSVSQPQDSRAVKLPTIPLPTFDGTIQNWLEFRDTYESLIHYDIALLPIRKYHYLRAALKGDAAQVIKCIGFTAADYDTAWNVLCKRYNNNRLLVRNHVKALFTLEQISNESAVRIRKLIDDVSKHLLTLKSLEEPTQHWDTLLIYMISEKIDPVTQREWEEHKADKTMTLESFLQFLRNKANLLETLERTQADRQGHIKSKTQYRDKYASKSLVAAELQCVFCKGNHLIYSCTEFMKLATNDRIKFVKKENLCLNCLRKGHQCKVCKSGNCRKCNAKHNTLLHIDSAKTEAATENALMASEVIALASHSPMKREVLLSTALVQIADSGNNYITARALLDCGSQSSFMTYTLAKRLQLKQTKINLSVAGINQAMSNIRFACTTNLRSQYEGFKQSVSFLLLQEITGQTPAIKIETSNLNIPPNIRLADPAFAEPGNIDILLGADCFWNLLCAGRITLGQNKPILQKTRLGWIVAGTRNSNTHSTVRCNFSKAIDIQAQLQSFWEIEDQPTTRARSKEENECEAHFVKHNKRASNGQFIVSVPLKENREVLGDSQIQARRRFMTLERKLQCNRALRDEYIAFMREYEALGHMSKASERNDDTVCYYLPHHAVLKESSTTTKLRVVFDASAKTTSEYSLNDIQMVGPVLQDDILSILLRFRKHQFVVSADIAKMYRQVAIDPNDRPLHRILWRENPQDRLESYELNTVTYGTASASFLAIRCLHQLGIEHTVDAPKASAIIRSDFYVDDLLTGADDLEEIIALKIQITQILARGHFDLRKWSANDERVLSKGENQANVQISSNACKTLGIAWSPNQDILTYSIRLTKPTNGVTKRVLLSAIAQIFDPLGLLAPVIITAKILIQELWQCNINWDDPVPSAIHDKWIRFSESLIQLNSIRIPRHAICKQYINLELHGFADASSVAYGACIYMRSIDAKGNVHIRLLCAKAKVAPLKTTTIPRLELCGALLLAKLTDKVLRSLNSHCTKCVLWSDSTIVLGWIKTSPNLLKLFVGNRVAEIQTLTQAHIWRHVPTTDNPADHLSRGVEPTALAELMNWWHGPTWLAEPAASWPELKVHNTDMPEIRSQIKACTSTNVHSFLFDLYSDLNKLERILAYCLRFKRGSMRGPITSAEIRTVFFRLVKIAQAEHFSEDIQGITLKKPIKGGPLSALNPFIDADGLLRVRGRLHNSDFAYEKKHPIIINAKHKLAKLIFRREHLRLLHAGPQALLSSIRETLWPIGGRNLAKQTVRECVKCFRANPTVIHPMMGNLPKARVRPTPPFHVTGVDYAGPFLIKDKRGRGNRSSKCYIALFICFAIKAIHLELVSSLTSDAFIAAFRRFVSRRGKPLSVYSDNGTNFIGANAELKTFLRENDTALTNMLTNEGVDWHFIPAHSPHFGGLWEAGVKSTKFHLKRVLGQVSLVFEDFLTVLVQIEAVLNSRPLTSLSDHPMDLNPLTPAHFLVGRTLTSCGDPDVTTIPENRLSHYQRLQQLSQHFWARRSKEYISELQQRSKWKQNHTNLQLDTLVLVKVDNLPPLKWQLGRVVALHPGNDNISRVASVRTERGVIRRAVTKLCPLPMPHKQQGEQGV